MKIASLTFHDGINYGAYWQTFALHEVLKEIVGSAKIIDYKNLRHQALENLVFYHKLYNPKLIIENHQKIRQFRDAQQRFDMTKHITFPIQIRKLSLDTVVFGSDEIWNYKNPLLGYDPLYFGKYLEIQNKISYAASFGVIPGDTKLPQNIIDGLSKFSSISVRDKNSKKIIQNNLKINAPIVLDPTLLLDLDKYHRPYTKDKDYILLYCTKVTPGQQKEILQVSKHYNKKIISVGYRHDWCSKSLVAAHPDEWLGLYKASNMVITNMYHGTIIAIKYQKPFISISSQYRKNKINGILSQAGLKDRMYKTGDMLKKLDSNIDYKTVEDRLSALKEQSLKYLQNAITKKARI